MRLVVLPAEDGDRFQAYAVEIDHHVVARSQDVCRFRVYAVEVAHRVVAL